MVGLVNWGLSDPDVVVDGEEQDYEERTHEGVIAILAAHEQSEPLVLWREVVHPLWHLQVAPPSLWAVVLCAGHDLWLLAAVIGGPSSVCNVKCFFLCAKFERPDVFGNCFRRLCGVNEAVMRRIWRYSVDVTVVVFP